MKRVLCLLASMLLFLSAAGAEDLSYLTIEGKDGWLFYDNVADGDPIGDYQGQTLFDEETLARLAAQLQNAADVMAARGGTFVLFIAPNKERVYADCMPERYGAPALDYRVRQLVDYLRTNTTVQVLWVLEDLMQTRQEVEPAVLFYRHDTHWNDLGAYCGTRVLMQALGVTMPALSETTILPQVTDAAAHDLATYRGLTGEELMEEVYTVTGFTSLQPQFLVWEFAGDFITHCEGADPRRFLMVRDSFCTAMLQFLGAQFTDCRMVHYSAFTPELLQTDAPDILVYECVERALSHLESFDIGLEFAEKSTESN